MSVNKVILLGYVSNFQEVQIKELKNGKKSASFVLVTSESWKEKNGEKKTKYENHRVVVFSDGLVGIIEKYIKKGTKLFVEGSLQTRKWTGNDGIEKYTTEIVLQGFNNKLEIIDNRKEGEGSASGGNSHGYDDSPSGIEDDIPF
jgi:single-strand DNA-binding protein